MFITSAGKGYAESREAWARVFFGYSGEVYRLTPVEPEGRETERRKISRREFEHRLEKLLSDGEPWTVYFNFRLIGRDTGVLVRFDRRGRVASGR